eukprot:TRINITY_DN6001_c0_g1_i2.p1 TRINITY_DN6001_c0_g1~~TRINITY_DN6001_c0_g1_i2.p1  ORF type:complete len:103 (+),score=18.06 TRINITY_DN6001_c0_g1_i2:102-410(+)
MCIRDRYQRRVRGLIQSAMVSANTLILVALAVGASQALVPVNIYSMGHCPCSAQFAVNFNRTIWSCLLYTSDAADEEDSVDLGGRRIIYNKKTDNHPCNLIH